MNPVAKALWFIESHSSSTIALEDIAAAAGVSRFHLSRAFAAATGYPIMRYLRGRRLSEAARRLAAGAGIPRQWQRLQPYLGRLEGQVDTAAYGVTCNTDEDGNMDYLCGVEVADFSRLPADFTRLRIAAQRYAVFLHSGHIPTIRGTWGAIWSQRLPESKHEAADAPVFERYDERFDGQTGNGEVEIWIPLAR